MKIEKVYKRSFQLIYENRKWSVESPVDLFMKYLTNTT